MTEQLAPQVQAAPTNVRRESEPKANGVKRATEDQRPTEINTVAAGPTKRPTPAKATTPLGTSPVPEKSRAEYTKPAAVSIAEAMPRPGMNPLIPVVGVVAVLALIGVGIWAMVGGGPDRNAELEVLYKASQSSGDYSKVIEFCEKYASELNYQSGTQFCEPARKSSSKAAPPVEPPVVAEDPPVEEDDDDVVEEPPPEIEDPPTLAKAVPPRRPKKTRTRTRKPKRTNGNEVRALMLSGQRALMAGDLSAARESLEKCVAKDRNFPDCHRLLGILYAKQDETRRSVKHYERYVKLRPDAPDAKRVRQIIKAARDQGVQ
jgi:hypothetical protein